MIEWNVIMVNDILVDGMDLNISVYFLFQFLLPCNFNTMTIKTGQIGPEHE